MWYLFLWQIFMCNIHEQCVYDTIRLNENKLCNDLFYIDQWDDFVTLVRNNEIVLWYVASLQTKEKAF